MHLLSVFSLRNRALIALLTIVVGIFGGIALTSLKQELIPSVSFPQLVVVTAYPGASPDVVETDVSTPIETAIQGVAGLESTVATSTSGASTVSASFVYAPISPPPSRRSRSPSTGSGRRFPRPSTLR